MIRSGLNWLSPAGGRGRLSVLIFHRVLGKPDPIFPGEIDSARFSQLCARVRNCLNVLPLDEAVRHLKAGTLPARAAAITFDDGYADNHDHALPILQRYGLSATFFIATGFIGGGVMFNDRVIHALRHTVHDHLEFHGVAPLEGMRLELRTPEQRRTAIGRVLQAVKYLPLPERDAAVVQVQRVAGTADPGSEMMNWSQVRALRDAGMQIGAHTMTHPILARLDPVEAREEISKGRRDLQEQLQQSVTLFAYPNGKPDVDYSEQTVALAREVGFDAAVTTASGAASRSTDPYQIPRFTPWNLQALRFELSLARNLHQSRHGSPVARA